MSVGLDSLLMHYLAASTHRSIAVILSEEAFINLLLIMISSFLQERGHLSSGTMQMQAILI